MGGVWGDCYCISLSLISARWLAQSTSPPHILYKLIHCRARQDPFSSYCYRVRLWQMDVDWLNGYLGDTISPCPPSSQTSSGLILILLAAGEASRNISIYVPTTKTFICIKYFFLLLETTFLKLGLRYRMFFFSVSTGLTLPGTRLPEKILIVT